MQKFSRDIQFMGQTLTHFFLDATFSFVLSHARWPPCCFVTGRAKRLLTYWQGRREGAGLLTPGPKV